MGNESWGDLIKHRVRPKRVSRSNIRLDEGGGMNYIQYAPVFNIAYYMGCSNFNHTITQLLNKLHVLWNPEVQCRIHKGPPIISILSLVNSNPLTGTYFLRIYYNIVLPAHPGLPRVLFNLGTFTISYTDFLKYYLIVIITLSF